MANHDFAAFSDNRISRSARFQRSVSALGLAACALVLAPGAGAVGTRHFVLDKGADFKGGDLKGVAVDSAGGVRAGLTLSASPISGAATLWAALPQRDGSLLLGTGNEGKVLRLSQGTSSVVAETKALVATSLVEGFGSAVFVGTLPEGRVFKFDHGKLSEFARLKGAEHVWQVAYDPKAQALYAATGPEGKLFRISQNGDAQVFFDAEEQQIMSVAVAPDGTVYAGASDKAKLYRVTAPGRASVLYDFGRTEVRAISVARSGDVYAIANEIKPSSQLPPRQPHSADSAPAAPLTPGSPAKGKGTLYRFSPDGRPDQLLDDTDEHYTSLTLGDDGRPYVGTGVEGRVYSVDENHNSVLVADLDERQVTALSIGAKQGFVAGSDPAVIHPIKGVGGPDAIWTSKVLDAGIRARFGRMEWEATGTLQLSTRSGNTREPDETWSAWSKELETSAKIESPPARYLQVRARFAKDVKAVLSDVDVSFQTDNLRAVVTEITAKGGNAEEGLKSSGGPVQRKPDPALNITWKVDNPDKDELRYRLKYRLLGSNTWYDLTKPNERISKENYSWDTSDLPEGRYRIKVVASDELSNPVDRVTSAEMESGVVLVDNTPPIVEGLKLTGRRLQASVVDGVGPVQRVEVSVAGSDEWRPLSASDGIFDEQRESIDVDLSQVLPAGPALVSVRAYDGADNFVVRNVTLR